MTACLGSHRTGLQVRNGLKAAIRGSVAPKGGLNARFGLIVAIRCMAASGHWFYGCAGR